jgi:ligand-binding sensor domain-containing protein
VKSTRIQVSVFLSMVALLLWTMNGCKDNPSANDNPGPQWKVYTKSNTNGGLIDNHISWITDGGNKIWFATNKGASFLTSSGWGVMTKGLEYYTYSQGGGIDTSRAINVILAARDGSTWFGLAGGGLRRYAISGSEWTNYSEDNGLSGNLVVGLSQDIEANIFCATSNGVTRYVPNHDDPTKGQLINYFSNNSGLPTDYIQSVQANLKTNEIWFGSQYGDLIRFDGNNQWKSYPPPTAGRLRINALALEGSSFVLLATANGVFRLSLVQGEWNQYLSSTLVNAVTIDASGTKWFGTEKGLERLKNDVWSHFDHSNCPLPSDFVSALAIDIKGNLWIGTDNGVAEFNEEGTR